MIKIIPYVSVGQISFFESRKEVQLKINFPFNSGVKEFEEIQDFYDHFTEMGLLVYYDKFDKVNAFEFFKGNLLFENVSLFEQSYQYLLDFFYKIDNSLSTDFTGFNSEKFGIAIYAPEAVDNTLIQPQSIFIYRKGYYNE